MKVRLMNPDSDFAVDAPETAFSADLAQDLQLSYLWDAMGAGDDFIRRVGCAAILQPLSGRDVIAYRQDACRDAAEHPESIARLYELAVEALHLRRKIFLLPVHDNPTMELNFAVRMLTGFTEVFGRLRELAAECSGQFSSTAFSQLFAVIGRELDDDYIRSLRAVLAELTFDDGLLMHAGIGTGGVVVSETPKRPVRVKRRWRRGVLALRGPHASFTLPERDEAGANALTELRQRGLNDIANAATQSVEHVLSFFKALRTELAFFLGCNALAARLRDVGCPMAWPTHGPTVRAHQMYDPCLALATGRPPVGNDVDMAGRHLLLITGANRGGKSTLLRALGTAQLMMQAGMFVAAQEFQGAPVGRIFTHWAREEDTDLVHGKFDDELERMAQIVSMIAPGDLLLCNETFASTNEIEGSEILFEIAEALVNVGIRLHIVTHLFDFASRVTAAQVDAVYLRAPRRGGQDFRLQPGPPLPTSYGLDLYDSAFGTHYADR